VAAAARCAGDRLAPHGAVGKSRRAGRRRPQAGLGGAFAGRASAASSGRSSGFQ
jgi:hypothetical protein